ncbi:hypothetical protein ACWEFD_35525, partial [Streptomyces ardesiacus]
NGPLPHASRHHPIPRPRRNQDQTNVLIPGRLLEAGSHIVAMKDGRIAAAGTPNDTITPTSSTTCSASPTS